MSGRNVGIVEIVVHEIKTTDRLQDMWNIRASALQLSVRLSLHFCAK